MNCRISFGVALGAVVFGACISAPVSAESLRLTWMIPRTVIDSTIVYTLNSCAKDDSQYKMFQIAPTLVPHGVPDLRVGEREIITKNLNDFWTEKNITLQTIVGSRILSSIGSQPTNQTGPIVGSFLGGVAKLVGIALGVTPADLAIVPPAARKDLSCSSDAKADLDKIKELKQKLINDQAELASSADATVQKNATAAIQADQSAILSLQSKWSITVKTTIDPGVNPVKVDPDDITDAYLNAKQNGTVTNSGLVAQFCPSLDEINKAKWFDPVLDNKMSVCDYVPALRVNVYLDFKNGQSLGQPLGAKKLADWDGDWAQTEVDFPKKGVASDYRDVAYIPVLVWRGEMPSKPTNGGGGAESVLLAPPQLFPFGQFGVAQRLPFDVQTFSALNWSVAFSEMGEISNSSFKAQAKGTGAAALFGSAIGAANSIATEARAAASPSAEATMLQGQADVIYQTNRLQLCRLNPMNCPSK